MVVNTIATRRFDHEHGIACRRPGEHGDDIPNSPEGSSSAIRLRIQTIFFIDRGAAVMITGAALRLLMELTGYGDKQTLEAIHHSVPLNRVRRRRESDPCKSLGPFRDRPGRARLIHCESSQTIQIS